MLPGSEGSQPTAESNRRRLGRIVHDERGYASVQWHDAPSDYQRPVLEVEGGADSKGRAPDIWGTDRLTLEAQQTFDPYASSRPVERRSGATSRTDLRKLSNWIKMMRELEERRQRGEPDEVED
jgi:hypothetical protein